MEKVKKATPKLSTAKKAPAFLDMFKVPMTKRQEQFLRRKFLGNRWTGAAIFVAQPRYELGVFQCAIINPDGAAKVAKALWSIKEGRK